jgi:hypothetical protein
VIFNKKENLKQWQENNIISIVKPIKIREIV